MWSGLILFVIGAVFLLQRFDLIPAETWFYLWPILLLVLGVKMMVSGGSKSCCPSEASATAKTAPAKKKTAPKKKAAPKKKRKVAKK